MGMQYKMTMRLLVDGKQVADVKSMSLTTTNPKTGITTVSNITNRTREVFRPHQLN